MSYISVFLFEWKHFVRSPFKILALLLFIVSAIYGLHTGEQLYNSQNREIERIESKAQEARQKIIDEHYETGIMASEERPWVDYSSPYWSMRGSSINRFKRPSPSMVYSIGQSEQYGFYKGIDFWASPYDADLAEEIANPERLYKGTLDFSFSLLYLLPLLLLIMLYDIRSLEAEQGMLPLIELQTGSKYAWPLIRIGFYLFLMLGILFLLLVYGAFLTGLLATEASAFYKMLIYVSIYLSIWSGLYLFILLATKSVLGTTLQMTAVYLLITFIAPALVHQALCIWHPANLMTDFIDVREEEEELFAQSEIIRLEQIHALIPEIGKTPLYEDTLKRSGAIRKSMSLLTNELKKSGIQRIEEENQKRNRFIQKSYVVSPITFFQNQLNSISKTHFDDYQRYRNEIQGMIDKQIDLLVRDTWNEVEVSQERFEEYIDLQNQ